MRGIYSTGSTKRRACQMLAMQAGFTLMELLVTFGFVAVVTGLAISNLKELENPLADAGFQISHYLRLARSRAISKTVAIVVNPTSTTNISASTADDCDSTPTPLSGLTLDLPDETRLASTEWEICFTQRGLADENVAFDVLDRGDRRKTIEIALGGGVQIR